MKTIYSILSAQIRPEVQEKITIGFLLVGQGKVFFNYSNNKLRAIKNLLSDSSYMLLKSSLKNIAQTAIHENEEAGRTNDQPVLSSDMVRDSFSKYYINYLSKYNNNVLSFSATKEILVEANEEIFSRLFQQFIDDSISKVEGIIRENDFESFKIKNQQKLEKHFNLDKELTFQEIPHLIAPVKPDLIGKNKSPVFAQSIDLEQRINLIEYDLAQLLLLQSAFDIQKLKSIGFVVANEPEIKNTKNHQIWKQLRTNSPFEYVDVSEANKILDYANGHDVTPWISVSANE
jgi:hypothetical protein